MSLQIPLAAVASQRLSVVLANQNCQIALYQKTDAMYLDLAIDGDPILTTKICRNRIRLLLGAEYRGFIGDLVFMDVIGDQQPEYTELNTRYLLLYLTNAEL